MVRFFGDPDVTHVAGKVDPQSDVDTIKTELILADIATVEKAIPRLEKEAKRDKAGVAKLEAAKKVLAGLNEGHRARTLGLTEDEVAAIYELHLLTMKPMLYIANVDEDAVDAELPEIDGCTPVPISAKVEADIAELAEMDPDEATRVHGSAGAQRQRSGAAHPRGLPPARPAELLHRAARPRPAPGPSPWAAKAPQAAGVIHTDFERGFIKAETASFEDYVALGGEKGCRDAGKLRQEGKDYVVQDGDVMHFKFNV